MDVIEEVQKFYTEYSGEKGYFGVSEIGRLLCFMRVGTGRPTVLLQYAMHAREYITAYLALEQIKHAASAKFSGSLYFAPLVNPDGVEICLGGEDNYKANALGVDLNVNFDARWGTGKSNTRVKGAENYIGEYPFSAAETRALRDFTYGIKPDMTVSYHSKGEEIYWYFYQQSEKLARDKALAEHAASLTGYRLAIPSGSAGGYKDWCVEKLGIPALTIEVGSDSLVHPIGKAHLGEIAARNKTLPIGLAEKLTEFI